MAYYINYEEMTLHQFKSKLQKEDLIKSHTLILESIDERFLELKNHDVHTVADAQKLLKTKKLVENFSEQVAIPFDYLILLRRIINSYHPKARKLNAFIGIDKDLISLLASLDFKTTEKLYNGVMLDQDREKLMSKVSGYENLLIKLIELSDLCRLRYVNEAFAVLLYEANYKSVKEVSQATPQNMNETIQRINKEMKIYGGNIGEKDMKFLIEDSKCLTIDFEL